MDNFLWIVYEGLNKNLFVIKTCSLENYCFIYNLEGESKGKLKILFCAIFWKKMFEI